MKKLRGSKRHHRRAQYWADQSQVPSLVASHYDYRKIHLRPWSDWLPPKRMPVAIRQVILQGLLRTHEAWLCSLEKYQQPFYLAVWLFEQPFFHSQVVAGFDNRIAHYENAFAPAPPRPLPVEYQQLSGITALEWECRREIMVSDLPPYGKPPGYYCKTDEAGEILHFWLGSRVWVGRQPPPDATSPRASPPAYLLSGRCGRS